MKSVLDFIVKNRTRSCGRTRGEGGAADVTLGAQLLDFVVNMRMRSCGGTRGEGGAADVTLGPHQAGIPHIWKNSTKLIRSFHVM